MLANGSPSFLKRTKSYDEQHLAQIAEFGTHVRYNELQYKSVRQEYHGHRAGKRLRTEKKWFLDLESKGEECDDISTEESLLKILIYGVGNCEEYSLLSWYLWSKLYSKISHLQMLKWQGADDHVFLKITNNNGTSFIFDAWANYFSADYGAANSRHEAVKHLNAIKQHFSKNEQYSKEERRFIPCEIYLEQTKEELSESLQLLNDHLDQKIRFGLLTPNEIRLVYAGLNFSCMLT